MAKYTKVERELHATYLELHGFCPFHCQISYSGLDEAGDMTNFVKGTLRSSSGGNGINFYHPAFEKDVELHVSPRHINDYPEEDFIRIRYKKTKPIEPKKAKLILIKREITESNLKIFIYLLLGLYRCQLEKKPGTKKIQQEYLEAQEKVFYLKFRGPEGLFTEEQFAQLKKLTESYTQKH